MTTCRRATRPPRPLRRPRAPLPHGATWLAREHDCLEPILPRGPVPSIRGDCHRPDPFGVPTEKAGGKRDMSLLAERGGLSADAAPVHGTDARSPTGLAPRGAARPPLRGPQGSRRRRGSAPAARTPEAPERGSKGNSSLSGSLSQAPSCLPTTTKDTGGHDGRQPHRTYLCSPATPHTCDSPRERGGQRRHPRSHGREGPGPPPPHGHSHGHGHRHLRPICPGHPGSPASCPRFPGHALHRHAHHQREHRSSALLTGPSRQPQEEAGEPSLYRWGGEAPAQCGAARGGPVGPRPAPPHTSRQHARL